MDIHSWYWANDQKKLPVITEEIAFVYLDDYITSDC